MSNFSFLQRLFLYQIFFIPIFSLIERPIAGEIPQSALEYMPPMNEIYHPVSTSNVEAQKSFNQGLTYIFAFNHDLAFREFKKASELDPTLAMAYWGMAFALGQNINDDIKPENEIKCYDLIQKARQLSSGASRSEQDYISALAERYTNDPAVDLISLRFKYRDAMKKVIQAYSEDLDARTLYAESILNLDPWKWWTLEGKPKEGTMEAIQVLESVLIRNPQHIGANHYYVHALEESPYPERALMSAHRLEYLLPESGHLLHMPCHIFILVGDYESAMRTNKKAIAQDRAYIQKYGMSSGPYPLHYLTHNLAIMTRIYLLMEDYQNAINSSFELIEFIRPHLASMPQLAYHLTNPLQVSLYFHKWKEILDYPFKSDDPSALAFWHYSRAMAYAALGDLDGTQKEKNLMMRAKEKIAPQDEIAMNPASKVISLAQIMLDGAIAKAEGRLSDSILCLKEAVLLQESLNYDEPPAWTVLITQVLGFAYLQQQKYSEAETAFKRALKHLQRNGRSLFGLSLSLKGQNRTIDAYWVEREMTAALKHAGIKTP